MIKLINPGMNYSNYRKACLLNSSLLQLFKQVMQFFKEYISMLRTIDLFYMNKLIGIMVHKFLLKD